MILTKVLVGVVGWRWSDGVGGRGGGSTNNIVNKLMLLKEISHNVCVWCNSCNYTLLQCNQELRVALPYPIYY